MNLPNSLTIIRIILIPIFVVILLVRIPYGDYIA
ncbi:MAG TPA: CDP-diacylglycerol--glycerol-3-phosphate 3-phosphatidyltransferase, partial [Syntrophomonadaceae bacterium]|nr:CDP-diacylglycerol--glycerol-3-phosphate 3-phosphatidyltransferase [Syntrophomonadaceae bacterium]